MPGLFVRRRRGGSSSVCVRCGGHESDHDAGIYCPDSRRSSLSTLFEIRARTWLVRGLLLALLGAIAFALTWSVHR
jgi:hypothetical protein